MHDAPSPAAAPQDPTPWQLAAQLLRGRRVILAAAGLGLLVSAVVVLVRPRTYTATFSFLPKSAPDATRAGLAGLAGQFGINLASLGGQSEPPQLYADLLSSREILGQVAQDTVRPAEGPPVPVADYLRVAGGSERLRLENTIRALRRRVVLTTVATRTTGMVTVQVRTRDAGVSQAIAERLLERLNHFNLVTRQSSAREERQFTERRLADARANLAEAEGRLERFLRANRQIDGSPALRFENDRLQREVQLQQQVVMTLAQQYEENRIREVRDTPVLTVFERPNLPARPDPGMRALILAIGLLGGALLGIVAVLARDGWTTALDAGTGARELQEELRRARRGGR